MSNSNSNESSTPTEGAAASATTSSSSSAAAASRENFLRRLEQQQQRLDENNANNDDEVDQPNTVVNESSPAVSTVDTKHKSSPLPLTAKEVVSSNGNSTVDNDLLVNYLTQCSSKGGTASSTDVQSLIQDIDPSSFVFLKELATSSTSTPTTVINDNNDDEVFNNVNVTKQPAAAEETNATEKTPPRRVKKEKRRIRPKLLPTPNNDNDEQDLTNGELNDEGEEEGSTIRNELGFGDFATPKKKLLVAPSQPSSTVDGAADATNATATNNTDGNNNNGNAEQRLLELMEQNQNQMDQIQRRLDTLNNIMVQLVNDVGALRQQYQQQHSSAGGNNPYGNTMGQVLSSPPLPPPPSDDGTTPPLPPQQQLELQQLLQQQYSNQPPLPPQQTPPPPPQQQQPQPPRGILFPLLTTIYTTLTSTLPTQLLHLLQSTGPARIYIHIRREAIRRHAFQNVDWGSLVKMMVMVMIFSGKIGRNEQRPVGGGRRNLRNENGDGTIMGYVYELLENFVTWWRGHRVHTLIVASLIAFLFQVGLMSFFYQVLWVERGVLWNVYLGRDVGGEDDDGGGGNTNDNGENNHNEGGVNAPNGGLAGVIAGANPALNVPQQAAPAPALIRRGPNNGGLVHDVLCLILSFVMSLIPAWKPDEWADPEEEEGEEQQQQEEESDRPEVEDVTEDDLNDNEE